jgi:hypothetical protein
MGYCIDLVKSDFFLAADQKPAAMAAMRQLALHASDGSGMGGGARWFSWMNGTPFSTDWKGPFRATLEEVFDDWRYPVKTDEAGNIVGIYFNGEKLGDELVFFKSIAPYVREGSYLNMSGEDGERWQWFFDGTTCEEKAGTVIYG